MEKKLLRNLYNVFIGCLNKRHPPSDLIGFNLLSQLVADDDNYLVPKLGFRIYSIQFVRFWIWMFEIVECVNSSEHHSIKIVFNFRFSTDDAKF